MKPFRILVGLAFLGLAAPPALAHVVAVPAQAPAGGQQVVSFRVGHGCKGSATTVLSLDIPTEVTSAKPRPKPGWAVEIAKSPNTDGTTRVTGVTWRGYLSDDQFDDFQLLLSLPDKAQTLYFPAVQTCDVGEARWTQIPSEPAMTGLDRPAPALTLTPADPATAGKAAEHHH